MRIRLIREWDDHEPVVLGYVVNDPNWVPTNGCIETIQKLWVSFKNSDPDSDNDFLDFLHNNGYKVEEDSDDVDVVLGG